MRVFRLGIQRVSFEFTFRALHFRILIWNSLFQVSNRGGKPRNRFSKAEICKSSLETPKVSHGFTFPGCHFGFSACEIRISACESELRDYFSDSSLTLWPSMCLRLVSVLETRNPVVKSQLPLCAQIPSTENCFC